MVMQCIVYLYREIDITVFHICYKLFIYKLFVRVFCYSLLFEIKFSDLGYQNLFSGFDHDASVGSVVGILFHLCI